LHAALDVDNHFREFPRRAIPRARIFSRYVAFLKHVAAQEYERIVIVSHSQGTVISADLFRYMKERAANAKAAGTDDDVARLWRAVGSKIMLLTAGCPLRQLYAARFPEMYDWVLRDNGTTMGPAVVAQHPVIHFRKARRVELSQRTARGEQHYFAAHSPPQPGDVVVRAGGFCIRRPLLHIAAQLRRTDRPLTMRHDQDALVVVRG